MLDIFSHQELNSFCLIFFIPGVFHTRILLVLLSPQELKAIPGSEYLDAVDTLGLQVCVRQGTQIVVHPDQAKQWSNSGADLAEQFQKLKADHDEVYRDLLAPVIQKMQPASSTSQAKFDSEAVVVVEEEDKNPKPLPAPKVMTFESEAKLAEADPIKVKCVSEMPGVNLIKTASGKIYLCCDKDRILAKWMSVGGFGTGKCFGRFLFPKPPLKMSVLNQVAVS